MSPQKMIHASTAGRLGPLKRPVHASTAGRTRIRPSGILAALHRVRIPVQAPLSDIAMCVVKAPGIRQLAADRLCRCRRRGIPDLFA